MIFNSIAYGIFFLITIIVYYLAPARYQWCYLLLAGIFFYGYSNPYYISVPVAIILVTYWAGIGIENALQQRIARLYYITAIALIIAILVLFKYSSFFFNLLSDSIQAIFKTTNATSALTQNSFLLRLSVPLGISYISFQAIGYLIEIKRGKQKAEKHIGHFSAFLFFFPKLIAGPVERAHKFLPQIKQPTRFNFDNISSGGKRALWGLFKKIVIADRLALYINTVYDHYNWYSGITLLFAAILYVFQIYADFSGYTDMALGFSKMLGIDLMENFNRPLLAKSVTEFWRKWHISLSTWFADYFYMPIAIDKRHWGNAAIVYASFVTFITLGFWHGANWTFIVFGALQAMILTLEFLTVKFRKEIRKKIPIWFNNLAGNIFTFSFFALSLIFFRSNTVTDALRIIGRIANTGGPFFVDSVSMSLFILMAVSYILLYDLKKEYFNNWFSLTQNRYWIIRNGFYCLLIIIILVSAVFDGGEFIYFQF